MTSSINFNFHETFSPQMIYLSELLELAKQEFVGNKFEISNLTNIPTGESSGKVIPHIKYLSFMGLINYNSDKGAINLKLTELGKVVYEEDKYILQDLTKVLLHYNLSNVKDGAPQWSFLFRLLSYDLYIPISISSIEKKGMSQYGKNIEITPIKSLYGENGEFSNISYIDIRGKEIEFKMAYPLSEYINCYSYTLLNDWEKNLNSESEITLTDVVNKLKWNKGFGFDYETTLEVIDEISSKGYIKINKQLNPVTIIRVIEAKDIIPRLYEDLI